MVVQGRHHAISGTVCQDKTYILNSPPDCVAVALADGAGSAGHSELGAQCVTETICRVLTENFTQLFDSEKYLSLPEKILSPILKELNALAAETKCELRELASTLLTVCVKGEKFIGVHIGDGVIGALDADSLKVLSLPDNGEFLNETTFVTSAGAMEHLRFYKGDLEEISAFVLMSDGTAAGFYDRKTKELMPIVKKIIHAAKIFPTTEVESGLTANFRETLCKVTGDDCSLVLLVKAVTESRR